MRAVWRGARKGQRNPEYDPHKKERRVRRPNKGREMIVKEWMTKALISVGPDAPILEAAELMSRRRVRRLTVTSTKAGAELVGIVSATDIYHAFPADVNPFAALVRNFPTELRTVREIMKPNPLTISQDAPLEEAAALMREKKIGALPALRNKELVGIITESDVFRAFVAIFSATEASTGITFEIQRAEDGFALISDLAKGLSVHVLNLFTATQEDARVCAVRVTGRDVEKMTDAIWKSNHRVLSITRWVGREDFHFTGVKR
jgi:acetoin utilization protein AcuB